jgi:hypothetical protein
MKDQLTFEIGGLSICLSVARPMESIALEPYLRTCGSQRYPEIHIRGCYGPLPCSCLDRYELVFDSESNWRVYRRGDDLLITVSLPESKELYKVALFDSAFARGTVHTNLSQLKEESPCSMVPSPLEPPLDQLLIMSALSKGRGIMAHACGVDDHGKGHLFVGGSSSGKSTMARLWMSDAVILNDERVILRRIDGRFWMFGTPWHGDHVQFSLGCAPVQRIFFINHSTTNTVTEVGGALAASMLLVHTLMPLWDREGIDFALDLITALTCEIPCYRLGFVPDARVIGFLRCVR